MTYNRIWIDWQRITLVFMQISSIFLTIQTYFRFNMHITLLKMRQKLRDIDTVFSSGNGKLMILEMIVGLLHPNYLLHSNPTLLK